MSTRAGIGYKDGNNIIIAYCHFDGYPAHVGKILVEYHNTHEDAVNIANGGDIRNFDHDGTICRYGDGNPSGRVFETLEDALNGFDYLYLHGEDGWECFKYDAYSPWRQAMPVAI